MFSKDAKDEIARRSLTATCCRKTFLRAVAAFASPDPSSSDTLALSSTRPAVVRAIVDALHRAGTVAHVHTPATSSGRWRVSATVRGSIAPLTSAPSRRCCQRTALSAAFLAGGSVSDPRIAYHLEFVSRDLRAARVLRAVFASLGLRARLTHRRRRPLLYLKDASDIAAALTLMGAHQAVLELQGRLVVRQTKNAIRRTVNAETANAARSAVVGARQRRAAVRLLRASRRAALSPCVREAATLRIAHPSGTLAELARRARPPITKAAMASRLRLLERLAER